MVERGYKQTEIGVIPEDWEVVNWTEVFDFKSTASYSRAEINENGEIGYIHYGDIHTKIDAHLDVNRFVSGNISKDQLKTYSLIKEGDLIMADASEDYFGIGKSFEVIGQPLRSIISGLHTFLIREKERGQFARGFKGYFYYNTSIKRQFDALATGLKVYSLSKGSFKNIQIPLPPLPEQQAIAQALIDADAWIANLEQLIAKKRLIKQGAMQQLLRPKEDWEVKKLGGMVNFKNGAAHENVVDENGSYVIVNSKFISREGMVRKYSNAFLCPLFKNEIVMVMSDIPNGKALAKCFIIDKDDTYTLNQRICAFNVKDEFDSNYLFFKINRNDYYLAFDSGSGQTNLRRDEVLDCPISIPKSKGEQTRIATILLDINSELKSLADKLVKARQIKQGMMQELLTGRVRLV